MREHVEMKCDGEYIEIVVTGDVAYATARLDITVTPKNGGAAKQHSGNTQSVFKRLADEKWRLARDANLLTSKSN